jgi:hypothetical protein
MNLPHMGPEDATQVMEIMKKQVRARTSLSQEDKERVYGELFVSAETRLNRCANLKEELGISHIKDHEFNPLGYPLGHPGNNICAMCGDWYNHHASEAFSEKKGG